PRRGRGGRAGRARSRRRAAARARQRRRHGQPGAHLARARRDRGDGRLGPVRAGPVRRVPRLLAGAGGAVRAAGRAPSWAGRGHGPRRRLPRIGPGRSRAPAASVPAGRSAPGRRGGRGRGADAPARRRRRRPRAGSARVPASRKGRRAVRAFHEHARARRRPDRRSAAHLSRRGDVLPVSAERDPGREGGFRPAIAAGAAGAEGSAADGSSSGTRLDAAALISLQREVVETLAPLDRTPCSAGEREAAEWLAARLAEVEGVDVALEDEPSWGTFPPTATGLGLLGLAGATLVLRGRRALGGLVALATLAGIVDEAHNGPRVLRRLVRRRRSTVNLIACTGDRAAPCTLVVLAHHDAPQTGMLYDQTLQRRLFERAPGVLERFKTPLPQWWFGLSGPLWSLLAALSGRRGLARGGLAVGVVGTLLIADIWRSETVQGANDNLSGVAGLVGLAELLRRQPVPGLRV